MSPDNFGTVTLEGVVEDIAQRLPMADRKLMSLRESHENRFLTGAAHCRRSSRDREGAEAKPFFTHALMFTMRGQTYPHPAQYAEARDDSPSRT